MMTDNLSYYNCRADYFGFVLLNTQTYCDSGASFRMVGCRRLQMVLFYIHTHTHTHKLHRFVVSEE